ncbi:MAG TPA: ATP-dependent DNA ligase [Nitrososphaeraceae archaeon]|nr:ATP-dependent DNA ligase [Nitrososphaeraceae archaeon]
MENQNNDQFSLFVETCEKIRSTTKKNEKTEIISNYITNLDETSLSIAVLFLSGRALPIGSTRTLNIGFNTIMESLSEIAMLDIKDIQNIHLKHGDIGAMAEYAVSKKHIISLFNQQERISLSYVYHQFKKIANISGFGSNKNKKNILKGLLIACSPLESKYLIKIITGEMRIGSVEGLVEIALSRAFDRELQYIREAMLISGDISQVAVLAKKNILHNAVMRPFVPVSFMLADVMFSAEEIINYYNKPLICEYKYDGIRLQMHKFDNKVRLFSRNLVDITYTFPELVKAAIESTIRTPDTTTTIHNQIDFILDGELIALKNDRPLHFQELQKRLRRKNVTEDITTEIPIYYIVYDIMYFKDNQVLKKSLLDRKNILSTISFKKPIINSSYKILDSIEQIIAIFNESKDIGHEGLVVKDPLSQYHPGKRGRYWMKLKKELDTIDAVIVIAEYGHGKRAGVLSDYTFAVIDEDDDEDDDDKNLNNNNNNYLENSRLKTIGKAYSGLTDKEIDEMTERLREIIIEDNSNRILVKPEIVLEVAFDTIQKSDRHNSGFALRFPRIKNIRTDKGLKDIDTLEKVRQIYKNQVYVKHKEI